jgi:hypothetical protein
MKPEKHLAGFGKWRWSWRKALGLPESVLPSTTKQDACPAMQIGLADVLASQAKPAPLVPIEELFRPHPAMDGVIPANKSAMALDALPAVINNPLGAFGGLLQGALHEGLYFMGYPYLAQLSQRVEYRHAYEIWAEHTTRKWIKLRGDDEKVKKINDALVALNARAIFQRAAEVDGLFGRSQIFLDFDDADDAVELGTELLVTSDKIDKTRPLKRLRVIEPYWTSPAPYNTTNPLAADFYVPTGWYVYGKEIHASRLMTIVGRPVPDMLKPSYGFGGQSLAALMKPYVDNWLRTRQSASDLMHAFSVMVFATDMTDFLSSGAAVTLGQRVALFNNYRDNNGSFVINKESEELTNVAAPIAGVEGLVGQAQEQLASAARIPLSIYLQITPTGLNASSEGEIRSFYADIHAYQEDNFRGPLQRIIECIQLGLFDSIDPEIGFDFEPLWEMSDKDKAEIIAKEATADGIYIDKGVVSNEETRERLKNDEGSLYHGVNLEAPAPEPEPEPDDDENPDANDPDA